MEKKAKEVARTIVERIVVHLRAEQNYFALPHQVDEWVALVVPVVEELVDRVTCAESNAADCHVFCHEADARAEAAEKERDLAHDTQAGLHRQVMAAYEALGEHNRGDLVADVVELCSRLAEAEAAADLRWNADRRAIERWHEAGNPALVWPDHADLCVWLLGEVERLKRAMVETVAKVHADDLDYLRKEEARSERLSVRVHDLEAEVERLTLACANAVPMSALQAEEAESERLSQRVRELEAGLGRMLDAVARAEHGISEYARQTMDVTPEFADGHRGLIEARRIGRVLLSPQPAPQPSEPAK